MDSFGHVEDMSVNSNKNQQQIVTIQVGDKLRAFQVPLRLLGPLAASIISVPGTKAYVPHWDADVFNLVVNWAYKTPLPRVRNLARWFNLHILDEDLDLPNADQFAPFVHYHIGAPIPEHFQTITAKPQYGEFSIEELRLHFTATMSSPQVGQDKTIEYPRSHSENTTSNQAHPADGTCEEHPSTLSRLTLPCCIPDEAAETAEKGQILLLKLAIFAQKYKWEPLFNDAIDAFQYGEAQLRRLYVPDCHIGLAFAGFQTSGTLQRFIIDHAIALGYKHHSMSKYRDILSSHPKFLSHVLSGMDSSTLVGFRRDLRQISNSSPDGKAPTPSLFTNQLDPLNAFYHTHDGRLVIDCKCRTAERRSSQTGSSGAPSLNQ